MASEKVVRVLNVGYGNVTFFVGKSASGITS